MPRRIVDGEGVWGSDKLAKVKPEKYRAEYTNILPLSLANGVFEAHPSRVWSTVYAYNRPDVSRSDVEKLLAEFERVGLLFRWTDESGKSWGYFIGSDKRGRLPSQSLRERYGVGPVPPEEKLAEYLLKTNGQASSNPASITVTPRRAAATTTTLPADFQLTDELRQWAKSKGYTRLEEHYEHFVGVAKAKGYKYANWNQAFQNAVRQNWARLPAPVQPSGPSALERAKAQLEAQ